MRAGTVWAVGDAYPDVAGRALAVHIRRARPALHVRIHLFFEEVFRVAGEDLRHRNDERAGVVAGLLFGGHADVGVLSGGGSAQVWVMDAGGENPKSVTHISTGAGGLIVAPNGKQVVFTSESGPGILDLARTLRDEWVIQVSGIIRPEDVGPNGTVQSRRLANAQIAYRGAGDLANATRAGWGTTFMHKYWPF